VTRQINTHDTTSKPITRVETDIIRQGVEDVDNTQEKPKWAGFSEPSINLFYRFDQ